MLNAYDSARRFVYRHARPIDLARWRYHFENGAPCEVLTALSAYQNEDGGFGHGLEADCWNPFSSPIQTWAATEILREVKMNDAAHPLVGGILRYLASGQDFDKQRRQWLNTVPENNDYPHAIWWAYKEDEGQFAYNPTAALAGFYLKHGCKADAFYAMALQIASEAYRSWVDAMPYAEQHVTACYIRLYEYCMDAGVEIADMQVFKEKLVEQVAYELSLAADKWETDYVCLPSNFIEGRESIFCGASDELIERECSYILSAQLDDGSFDIPWQWWTEYSEFEIAKNWWKSDFCIRKMRFLKAFQDATVYHEE